MAWWDSYTSSGPMWFNEAGEGVNTIPYEDMTDDERSEIGQYWNAVQSYLNGSDPSGYRISAFAGYSVAGKYFETDLQIIYGQSQTEDFDFREIYDN